MRKQIFLACVCLAAAFTGVAWAGPREEAAAAYRRGDYATAFQLWRPLAEQGDGETQMALGFMYHEGEGVPKDLVRAYMWFFLAASNVPADQQGFHDAMFARDFTAKKMTPEQIAEARDMAYRCQAQRYRGCD